MKIEPTLKLDPVRMYRIACFITMIYLVPLCAIVYFSSWGTHNLIMNMFGMYGIPYYPVLVPYYIHCLYAMGLVWMFFLGFSMKDPVRYPQIVKANVIWGWVIGLNFAWTQCAYLYHDIYGGRHNYVGVMDSTFSLAPAIFGTYLWIHLRKSGQWKPGLE